MYIDIRVTDRTRIYALALGADRRARLAVISGGVDRTRKRHANSAVADDATTVRD